MSGPPTTIEVPALTFRQEIVERPLFQQCVAPGQQESVPLAPFEGLEQDFLLVDPDADRLDRPGPAQFLERPVAAVAQRAHVSRVRVPMLVGADVVHIKDVDPPEAKPLPAVLDRAQDAVTRIVVDRVERHHVVRRAAVGRPGARPQEPADLGREHPLIALLGAQRVADGALGLAEPVIGRGVDIAHASLPRGADNRLGFGARDRDAGAAEGGAAQPERRHFERGSPDPALWKSRHPLLPQLPLGL